MMIDHRLLSVAYLRSQQSAEALSKIYIKPATATLAQLVAVGQSLSEAHAAAVALQNALLGSPAEKPKPDNVEAMREQLCRKL
jgi:hypothetical protein